MFWRRTPHSDFFKSIGSPTVFEKNSILPPGEFVYYLDEGLAALTMLMPTGDEKVYMYFKPGNLLGFIRYTMPDKHFAESFLPINLNSIVAKTPVRAYAIHHEHFFEVIEDDPGLYKDLSISLTQNLSNVLEHSYWLASADASTRLCLMLANFMEEVEGVFAIPRCLTYQEMGNFLSIHSVTVAKIVKSLVNEGIVVRKGHTLLISDPERLRQIARKEFFPKY